MTTICLSLRNLKNSFRFIHTLRSKMEKIVKISEDYKERMTQILFAKDIIGKGGVIALPTDTIYGLAASACNTEAVRRIYAIKNRNYNKPFAICVGEIAELHRWCLVNVSNDLLIDLLPGPVTLVFERSPEVNPELNPDTNLIGIRIPNYQFIRELASVSGALALTSANLSSEDSTVSVEEFQDIWPNLDVVFNGGCISDTPESRLGSTVVNLSRPGMFSILREGCAYKATIHVLKDKYNLEDCSR